MLQTTNPVNITNMISWDLLLNLEVGVPHFGSVALQSHKSARFITFISPLYNAWNTSSVFRFMSSPFV